MGVEASFVVRKYYQTEWQGIEFADFATLSSVHLAGPQFYQAFYEEFFRRHQNWQDLSPSWRQDKERCAHLVLAKSYENSKILSVGCGLGFIEHYIRANPSQRDLFIHEVAPSAWQWVGGEFSDEHKLIGLIPACLPDGIQFDLVYISAVDYALDDDALVRLLAAIRPFLTKAGDGGQCLLISASFQETPVTVTDKVVALIRKLRGLVAGVLDIIGLRRRGQFWGWLRTQKEYQLLMLRSGYRDIEEGFIDSDKRIHFWIAGR
jgi:hypothetical protein